MTFKLFCLINRQFIFQNFSIIYITMGFPRLSRDHQLSLAPSLLEAIESRPQTHQDGYALF